MNKSKFKIGNSREKKRSFYVAVGICLSAIAIASFVTYNNFKNCVLKDNVSKQSMEINKKFKDDVNKPGDSNEKREKILDYSSHLKGNAVYEKPQVNKEDKDSIDVSAKNKKVNSIVYPSESKDISKNYSGDNPVFSKTFNDWRVHNGVDFQLDCGSKVRSIADGEILSIFDDAILGRTVEIKHEGDFIAYYSGLNKDVLIKCGDKVNVGQDIGTIDNIPGESADGSHLHLSIKKSNKFIDPMDIIGKSK